MLESVSLDQLRVLIAIGETGSFSAASRRVGRAQSAISHAVATLESALEVTLFDRSGRTPRLTDAGTVILADARAVVARADELKARARSMARHVEPELSLAVDSMFPGIALTGALRALQTAFPLLPVAVFTEALGAVEARVLDGTCRLGIAPLLNRVSDRLEQHFLADITMISVVAAGHPLASWKEPIPRAELERHTQLVLTERASNSSGVMRGVVSPKVWRFADMATRRDFLLAGFGFCNMPLEMVAGDLEDGRLVRIAVEGWGAADYRVPLSFIHPRGETPGPASSWLIDHLKGSCNAAAPSSSAG